MFEVVWLAAGALLTGLSGLALLTPRPAGGGARLAVLGALLTHSGASAGHTGQHLMSSQPTQDPKEKNIFGDRSCILVV